MITEIVIRLLHETPKGREFLEVINSTKGLPRKERIKRIKKWQKGKRQVAGSKVLQTF